MRGTRRTSSRPGGRSAPTHPSSTRVGRSSTSCSSSRRTGRRITCSAGSRASNGVTEGYDGDDLRPLTPPLGSAPRRHPALLRVRDRVLERGPDEQLQQERISDLFAYTQMQGQRGPPQLLAMGGGVRAVGQLLLLRPGPFVPEPSLHDRRAVRRRPLQSRPGQLEGHALHPGDGAREVLGLRRARGGRSSRWSTARGRWSRCHRASTSRPRQTSSTPRGSRGATTPPGTTSADTCGRRSRRSSASG